MIVFEVKTEKDHSCYQQDMDVVYRVDKEIKCLRSCIDPTFQYIHPKGVNSNVHSEDKEGRGEIGQRIHQSQVEYLQVQAKLNLAFL